MATSKTLAPTGVTIQIPEFTDQPDQRVNSNCIDKEADAINALNNKITKSAVTVTPVSGVTVSVNDLQKFNGMVFGNINFNFNNAGATQWTKLATISDVPSSNLSFVAIYTNDGTYCGMISIQTTGDVKLYPLNAISSYKNVNATLCYKISP